MWSAPVLVVGAAAPAFALSPCPAVTLTYAGAGAYNSGVAGGITVTFSASGDTGAANNRTVSNATLGGTGNHLVFNLSSSTTRVVSQTVTVAFSSPVANLTFSFLDIDSATSGGTLRYSDQVSISAGVGTIVNAATVNGSGTSADPWKPSGANTVVATTSPNGNVNVDFGATQISTFSFVYSQPRVGTANTGSIGLSSLNFRPVLC